MFRSPKPLFAMLCALLLAGYAVAENKPWSKLGRAASSQEIAAFDTDVRADGKGLPQGSGSVEEGQQVYDAKCVMCHGTFGESNEYLQIAGGVGTLKNENPVRTTGSKLNYATTLWDYINRAMPFQAPKTLSADEVYSLTAYVLHLNEILPADATLDERSILQLKMPNADGFTQEHAFKTKDSKPDVLNGDCMKDCEKEVRIISALPEYATNSHGNLADQMRIVGPHRGVRTTKVAAQPQSGQAGAPAAAKPSAQEILNKNGCVVCHGLNTKTVGPGFNEVAAKYKGRSDAALAIEAKIRTGGSGAWGDTPMPPQAQVSEDDLKSIVEWILTGALKK